MLAIATVVDIWKREIHDYLWIGFGAVAVVLIFFEPNMSDALKSTGISLIIVPLALAIWRFGIVGGADALGLIVLGGLAPLATTSDNVVSPFTTLTNTALLSTVTLIANAARNLISISRRQNIFEGFEETRIKKIFAVFIGYRAKNPKYSFSIEKRKGNSKKLHFSLHHAEKTEFCNTPDTWVTPGVPYMLYIAAGFVVQIVFGDIILNAILNFPQI